MNNNEIDDPDSCVFPCLLCITPYSYTFRLWHIVAELRGKWQNECGSVTLSRIFSHFVDLLGFPPDHPIRISQIPQEDKKLTRATKPKIKRNHVWRNT